MLTSSNQQQVKGRALRPLTKTRATLSGALWPRHSTEPCRGENGGGSDVMEGYLHVDSHIPCGRAKDIRHVSPGHVRFFMPADENFMGYWCIRVRADTGGTYRLDVLPEPDYTGPTICGVPRSFAHRIGSGVVIGRRGSWTRVPAGRGMHEPAGLSVTWMPDRIVLRVKLSAGGIGGRPLRIPQQRDAHGKRRSTKQSRTGRKVPPASEKFRNRMAAASITRSLLKGGRLLVCATNRNSGRGRGMHAHRSAGPKGNLRSA